MRWGGASRSSERAGALCAASLALGCGGDEPPQASAEPIWDLIVSEHTLFLDERVGLGAWLGPVDVRPGERVTVAVGGPGESVEARCAPLFLGVLRAEAMLAQADPLGSLAPAQLSEVWGTLGPECWKDEFFDPYGSVEGRFGLTTNSWCGNPSDPANEAFCRALVTVKAERLRSIEHVCTRDCPQPSEPVTRETVRWVRSGEPRFVAEVRAGDGHGTASIRVPQEPHGLLAEYLKHLAVVCAYEEAGTGDLREFAELRAWYALRRLAPDAGAPSGVAFEHGESSSRGMLLWLSSSLGLPGCVGS